MLRLLKTLRIPVPELKAYLREKGEDVQKLQAYYADTAERDRELARLPGLFPELLFSTSVKNNIEVNYHTAGKGNGLAALCRHLGIDTVDAVAFGDSSNDTDMLAPRVRHRHVECSAAGEGDRGRADALQRRVRRCRRDIQNGLELTLKYMISGGCGK